MGALVAALLRAVLAGRDDPLVMVTVAGLLWVFVAFGIDVGAVDLVLAIVIACGFGYTSWLLGTASITGMLAGIISGLITIVLGGLGWFVILIAFFGLGGFASQYRYEEKRDLGVAEANEGARGSGNVLGNAAVALIAVVGFAAAEDLGLAQLAFEFVFAGSLATAMSDTFSSELGVLLGEPRLITNFETVPPGTDGGVTLLGTLIGAGGAAVVAVLSVLLLGIGPLGGLIVIVAGTIGMLVDSLLGATLEQRWIGNQGVNLGATSSGAVVGVVMAVGLGVV